MGRAGAGKAAGGMRRGKRGGGGGKDGQGGGRYRGGGGLAPGAAVSSDPADRVGLTADDIRQMGKIEPPTLMRPPFPDEIPPIGGSLGRVYISGVDAVRRAWGLMSSGCFFACVGWHEHVYGWEFGASRCVLKLSAGCRSILHHVFLGFSLSISF